ncbi:helix-hairpin-helix domain-containing protein, partial [Micromonospora globispora]|uniref:helix-hairpin-helix domain-containing protein n=1 Tax=Micromonospora globispora TaxID=1450148 RepID=UPI0021AB69E7
VYKRQESVDGTAAPVVETEPVAVEEPETPLVVEDEPTERPATVPAPRAAVEDDLPPVAAPDAAVAAAPVADNGIAAASNGSATTAVTADDFRRIQGIGPKMAAALQAAGIRSYQQLAELDEPALRETIKAAGLRATPSLATWPQQAKLLAGAGTDAARVLPVGADEQA